MFIDNSKADKLTLNIVSAWPYYSTLAEVPQKYKDKVLPNSGYRLMVSSLESGNSISGIYSWDGSTWRTQAQVNDHPSGTTANRPSTGNYIGRPYFDTDISKPLFWNGGNWVLATGSAP